VSRSACVRLDSRCIQGTLKTTTKVSVVYVMPSTIGPREEHGRQIQHRLQINHDGKGKRRLSWGGGSMISHSYLSDMISMLSTRNGHGSMGVCLPAAWRMYSPVGVSTLYSLKTRITLKWPPLWFSRRSHNLCDSNRMDCDQYVVSLDLVYSCNIVMVPCPLSSLQYS